MSMSLCLHVCLSVRSHIQKTHIQISPNFLCMLPVAVARPYSDENTIDYVLPVLWMTSGFHIMEPIQNHRWPCVSSSSPGGSTGGEVAVYDCSLITSAKRGYVYPDVNPFPCLLQDYSISLSMNFHTFLQWEDIG